MVHFVIHVGPHKTGTTYIQRRLDAGSAALRRQLVAVPTEWSDSEPNPSHTGLLSRLVPDRINEIEHKFRTWRTGGYRFAAISSEGLSNAPLDVLRTLRAQIGDDPFTIVYYVRAWPERVASVWTEGIVHRNLNNFTDFIVQNLRDP